MESLPPPISDNNDAVSIHLSYIRRDILDIKNTQNESNVEFRKEFTDLKNGFVSRTDFDEHLKADEDHEQRIRVIEKSLWKFLGASSAISAIISLIGSYILNHIIR